MTDIIDLTREVVDLTQETVIPETPLPLDESLFEESQWPPYEEATPPLPPTPPPPPPSSPPAQPTYLDLLNKYMDEVPLYDNAEIQAKKRLLKVYQMLLEKNLKQRNWLEGEIRNISADIGMMENLNI
jgi:hypothetical protein